MLSFKMRAEGSVSSKFPRIEPSAYSKTKFTERIVALAGVPVIWPFAGLTVNSLGRPNAANEVGLPVATI